jgi:hypothetical protein
MAVSKTLLSPRPFSATGRQEARAHLEPMDAEGVSFGARFALAGSVVDRDHAPRPQRRCGMVDGRIVAAVNGQDGARAMRPCCGNADRALVW